MSFNILFSTSWLTDNKIGDFVQSLNGLHCKSHVKFEGEDDAVIKHTDKVAIANDYSFYMIKLNCVVCAKGTNFSLLETFCFDRGWFDGTKSFQNKEYEIVWCDTEKGRMQCIQEKGIGEQVIGAI